MAAASSVVDHDVVSMSTEHVNMEKALMVLDAKNMSAQFAMPVLDDNLPAEFQKSLMRMAGQQVYSNALVLASFKRSFLGALDSATQNLAIQIEDSKKQVEARIDASKNEITDMMRRELKSADQALQGDLAKLHEKIDATHEKLEKVKAGAPSEAVMKRLEEMSQKIDARDWITEAWNAPANINLRQILVWILYTSLDTRNELGMTPFVNFMFFPGRDPTPEHHLTVINKALIKAMLLHQDKFTPPLQRGLQTQTEKNITPVFKCVQIEPVEAARISGVFPVEPFKQANGNCYIFRTKDLIRMMCEEQSYIKRDQILLPESANLQVLSSVDVSGTFQIKLGEGIDNLKKARAVKIRKLVGLDIPSLQAFAADRLRTDDKVAMLDYLAKRRYWNMPASREYLAQPEVVMGINLVRREVFGLEDEVKAEDGNYHLSADWQQIILDEEPESFASMMAEVLGFASGEEFVAKFLAYGEEEEEEEEEEAAAVDPELTEDEERPADDDGACEEEEKEEKSTPKKGKGKKRRAAPASSKKKKKAAVETSTPHPVVGGKSPRNPVMIAAAAAHAAHLAREEESGGEEEEGDAEEEDLEAAVAQTQQNIAAAASPVRNLRRRRDADAVDMDD